MKMLNKMLSAITGRGQIYCARIVIVLLIPLFVGCSMLVVRDEGKCVKLGQEWTYQTREGEEESRVVIVDTFQSQDRSRGYIVRVTGIKIDHPNFRNYFPDGVAYFILNEPGLNASLLNLVGESTWNKYFDRFYEKWRRESNNRDYYGFTIKDKIKFIDETLRIKLGA